MKGNKFTALLLTLCLLTGFAFAKHDGVEREKKITKSFQVNGNDRLSIENQFGKVVVNTWEKNEFSVVITIRATSRSSSKCDEIIESIGVSETRAGGTVYLKTNVKQMANRNGAQSFNIDYEVYMPSTNPLTVQNKFGNVRLPSLAGAVNVEVSYGNIKAERLTQAEKKIKVSFGSADIEEIEAGSVDSSYSKLHIGRFDKGELRNSFGKTELGQAGNLRITQKYGDLEIESINTIVAQVEFSNIDIEKLGKSADLNLKYSGNADLGTLSSSVELVKINAGFSTIYMRFDATAAFDFDASLKFGDLKIDNTRMKDYVRSGKEGSNMYEYRGIIGQAGGGKMMLTTQYTTVHFH